MNDSSGRRTLRERLPLAPRREQYFRWRGLEVSRVEGLTDGVFGFAVTLLVVALEVPRTFGGLMDVLRGFPAFLICFAMLMMFWNAHFRYHRRYGLEDPFTRVTTMAILVLVLFFVYPLKYLFTLVTVNLFGLEMNNAPVLEGVHQVWILYLVYGLGFAGVWGLYALLYFHALRRRAELDLDANELVLTRAALAENLIYVAVCGLSVTLAYATDSGWLPGVVYFALGPLQAFNDWWFGRRLRTAAEPAPGP
jgi:uncharacterized membrane protein